MDDSDIKRHHQEFSIEFQESMKKLQQMESFKVPSLSIGSEINQDNSIQNYQHNNNSLRTQQQLYNDQSLRHNDISKDHIPNQQNALQSSIHKYLGHEQQSFDNTKQSNKTQNHSKLSSLLASSPKLAENLEVDEPASDAQFTELEELIQTNLQKFSLPTCGNLRSTKSKDVKQRITCLDALLTQIKQQNDFKKQMQRKVQDQEDAQWLQQRIQQLEKTNFILSQENQKLWQGNVEYSQQEDLLDYVAQLEKQNRHLEQQLYNDSNINMSSRLINKQQLVKVEGKQELFNQTLKGNQKVIDELRYENKQLREINNQMNFKLAKSLKNTFDTVQRAGLADQFSPPRLRESSGQEVVEQLNTNCYKLNASLEVLLEVVANAAIVSTNKKNQQFQQEGQTPMAEGQKRLNLFRDKSPRDVSPNGGLKIPTRFNQPQYSNIKNLKPEESLQATILKNENNQSLKQNEEKSQDPVRTAIHNLPSASDPKHDDRAKSRRTKKERLASTSKNKSEFSKRLANKFPKHVISSENHEETNNNQSDQLFLGQQKRNEVSPSPNFFQEERSFQNLRQANQGMSSIYPGDSTNQGTKSLMEQASFFDDKRNQIKIKNELQQVDNFLNTEYAESEYAKGDLMLSNLNINDQSLIVQDDFDKRHKPIETRRQDFVKRGYIDVDKDFKQDDLDEHREERDFPQTARMPFTEKKAAHRQVERPSAVNYSKKKLSKHNNDPFKIQFAQFQERANSEKRNDFVGSFTNKLGQSKQVVNKVQQSSRDYTPRIENRFGSYAANLAITKRPSDIVNGELAVKKLQTQENLFAKQNKFL